MPTHCRFTELGHTAEIGLHIQADTIEQLFACSATGMFSLTRSLPDRRAAPIVRPVALHSIDAESLLVDWLSELLYLYETTGALLVDCRIEQISSTALTATATGYPPDHPPAVHVKAVTYHELRLEQHVDGWQAQVFFDI